MNDTEENIVKKITLTREKAGRILNVDPNATLRHIKFAYKKTSFKTYPQNVDTNKEDLLRFDLVSAAFKRLTSETSDDVYIEADYPFKLFRKAFKEKRVVTIRARNGTFIILGDKDKDDISSSEDEFDSSQYSFIRSSPNAKSGTIQNETMTKAEKNRLKKKKQKENKRQAKEDLQRQRDEMKEEKRKALNNQIPKGSNTSTSRGTKKNMVQNIEKSQDSFLHTSNSLTEEASKCQSYHDNQEEQPDMLKDSESIVEEHQHYGTCKSSDKSQNATKITGQHDEQQHLVEASHQFEGADNVICHDRNGLNNHIRKVSHGMDDDQLKTSACRPESIDTAPDFGKSSSSTYKQEASKHKFPCTKQAEPLNMSKHTKVSENMHHSGKATSKKNHNSKVEDPGGQLITSTVSKNPNNHRAHARLNNRQHRISLNKQMAQIPRFNKGRHPDVPKGNVPPDHAGHKMKQDVANSVNDLKKKHSRKPTCPQPSPNQVDVPQATKVSTWSDHVEPMYGEFHSANEDHCPSNNVSKARSMSYSIHDTPKNPTPVHHSTAANEACKNEVGREHCMLNTMEKTILASVHTALKLSLLGKDDAEKGNYVDAIASFTAAINLDSTNCFLYINRSYCHEKLGELDNALLDADCAIHISPDMPEGHLCKARVLAKMKRYCEAERVYGYILVLNQFNEIAKKELHEVRIELLVSMGYSRQKSSLAVERYPNVSSALENLLAGNLTDLVTDDIYVSDDEEIVHVQNTSSIENELQDLHIQHEHPIAQTPAVSKSPVTDQGVHESTSGFLDDNVDTIPQTKHQIQYYSVWLGNVTRRVKVDMLRRHFSQFGPIRNVRIHYEGKYAFVNYKNPESAPLAAQGIGYIEMNGMNIRISLGPGCKHSDSIKTDNKQNT